MIRQATILASNWMKDPVYGLEACLALLPEVQALPTQQEQDDFVALIKPKAIYNEQEDKCLMSDDGPTSLPALVVMADTDPEIEAVTYKPAQLAQQLTLVFLYSTGEEVADELESRYHAHLIGRAVRMSLNRWNVPKLRLERNINSLDGIKMVELQSMTEQRVIGKIGRSALKGAVLAELEVMDTKI